MTVRKYELQMPVELFLPEKKKKCILLKLAGDYYLFFVWWSSAAYGMGAEENTELRFWMAFSKSKGSMQKSWDAFWKMQCSQNLLNFRSSWDENLFLTNTGKISLTNWSTAFHILKRSIFQLTLCICPCNLRKGNCFLAYDPGQSAKAVLQ